MRAGLIHLSLIAVAAVLAGCASVADQRAALAHAQPCCASVQDSAIDAMRSATTNVVIDDRSPVGGFATGNSRYRVLDLGPLPRRPALLGVRSVGTVTNVYSDGMSWAPVFYPAVTFLNAGKVVLATVSEDQPQMPSLSCQALFHCGFAIVTVEVPADARYVVLHTPLEKVGKTRVQALPGQTADQTYVIGRSFVIIPGGGVPALRTIGMSVGELEVKALSAQ